MARARTLVLDTRVNVTGEDKLTGLAGRMDSVSARLKNAFSPTNLIAGGLAAFSGVVTAGLAGAVGSLIDIERLNAQTAAAIKSTGGVANVTLSGIESMSEGLESLTTVERETTQEAANMLLTFTRIRNEAGAGNDIFDQTTERVLDMSVAMGTDARTAALQLGKALNDPVAGMGQLSRAGVQFTTEQKEMVKALVASGDLLGAQKVILKELETQFGGSARAFADTTAGKIQRFQNDVNNMFESIILGFTKVVDFLGQEIDLFGGIGDRWEQDMGGALDAIGEFVFGAKEKVDTMPSDAKVAALAAVRAVEEEFEKGGPVVAKEAGKIAGLLPSQIKARDAEIRAAGANNIVQFAAGMIDKQNDPLLAMEALARANEEVLTRSAEITRLLGALNSTELAAGLSDGRPAVRLAAQAAAAEIEARLRDLGAWQWGYNTGASYAAGLSYSTPLVYRAAAGLASATGSQIGIRSEPKDHTSPLYGITKWGGNLVRTYAEGMIREVPTLRAASLAMAGAVGPGSLSPLAGSGGGVVNHNTFNLHWDGEPPQGRTEAEIAGTLKRLSAVWGY